MVVIALFQQVEKGDQLFPSFVMEIFGDTPCIPGLFVAGIFAGTLSSVSSGLNGLAAISVVDLVPGIIIIYFSPVLCLYMSF